MKIISVVGARPNFMKVAPLVHAIIDYNTKAAITGKQDIEHILVHTGQHYDDRMSKAFFEALNIPEAYINLGIGSGTHAEQVGNSMIALERVFMKEMPDWIVIFGDVNATMAATVAAKKLHIKVCHVEAGLRSFDEKMPEEINRLVTDRLSDLLLTPDRLSIENLTSEAAVLGVPSLRCNSFAGRISYLEEHETKYGLTYAYTPDKFEALVKKLNEMLTMPNLKGEWLKRKEIMLADKIDVTAFWLWFIEDYPSSANVMKENPDYQYRFK